MDWTFGIITDGTKSSRIETIIQSIIIQNIVQYEIIIVGGSQVELDIDILHYFSTKTKCVVKYVEFDDLKYPNWITCKKNLITKCAQYNNIAFLHDYIKLDPSWYRGFNKFGYDWDVCMTRIRNLDGTRYRDWIAWNDPQWRQPTIVPYIYNKTHLMYISGAYWVAKKDVMQKELLDETLLRGESEDVEWSRRILSTRYIYKMNTLSTVRLLKYKNPTFKEVNYV